MGITIIFGLMALASLVQAQQPFQIIGCSSGKVVTLSENQPLTVHNITGKGAACCTAGDKTFDDMTWDFVATLGVMDGKTIGIAYFKFMDPDQDYFILEANGDAILQGGDWKFLYGVGKWRGVTGKVKGRVVLRGEPLPVETGQYWCRIVGTLELPH